MKDVWRKTLICYNPFSGRMALLVTLFLVLVNIFNSVTANSPKAEGRCYPHLILRYKIYFPVRPQLELALHCIVFFPSAQ